MSSSDEAIGMDEHCDDHGPSSIHQGDYLASSQHQNDDEFESSQQQQGGGFVSSHQQHGDGFVSSHHQKHDDGLFSSHQDYKHVASHKHQLDEHVAPHLHQDEEDEIIVVHSEDIVVHSENIVVHSENIDIDAGGLLTRRRKSGMGQLELQLNKLIVNTMEKKEPLEKKNSLQHRDVSRQASKGSIAERTRKRSKKFSSASSISTASSLTDNPYIHLMHDARDRRLSSLSSEDSMVRRKISEGPSAFIAMRRGDSIADIGEDFTLGELEVEDSDELADSQLSKEKKAPNKPIRTRGLKFKAKKGGSKIFENYERSMADRHGQEEDLETNQEHLYTLEEADSRRCSQTQASITNAIQQSAVLQEYQAAMSAIRPPHSATSPATRPPHSATSATRPVHSGQPIPVIKVSDEPFARSSPARSTFCTSQINNNRGTGPEKKPAPFTRSQSFRKSFQKFGGEVAKTLRSLTGTK